DLARVADRVEDSGQRLRADLRQRVIRLDAALAAGEVREHQRDRRGTDSEERRVPPDLAHVARRLRDARERTSCEGHHLTQGFDARAHAGDDRGRLGPTRDLNWCASRYSHGTVTATRCWCGTAPAPWVCTGTRRSGCSRSTPPPPGARREPP